MKNKNALLLIFFVLVLIQGCAGLHLTLAPVEFENPFLRLGVKDVAPADAEKSGVLLRLLPPSNGILKSHEEITMFVKIQQGQGARTKFAMNHTDTYQPTPQKDVMKVHSEISFEGEGGHITQELESDTRGRIVRFIRGSHQSKVGKFEIKSWTRTSVFPEQPVKIGDSWNYEESMEVRLSSKWVKEKNPMPNTIKAKSTLKGFAEVKGKRTAVIQTQSQETKHEILKVLFRTIAFTIHTVIQETSYLDYQNGIVAARITTTQSETTSSLPGLEDFGQSQSIEYVV